jgi:PleD family two-component response regulator
MSYLRNKSGYFALGLMLAVLSGMMLFGLMQVVHAAERGGAVTAERIRTEFRKETFSPAPCQEVHKTVSIGLAQYKPQEEMKAFVHRVDQLMYQGKKNRKDRVCCEV